MSARVFVTGLGAVTASGRDPDLLWSAILNGENNIAPIQQADLSTWDGPLGGEVPPLANSELLIDRKLMKAVARHDVLGIHVAMQAVQHSKLIEYRDTLENTTQFNEETAVYVGSPGNKYYQQYDFLPLLAQTQGNMQEFGQKLFSEVHPMWLLRILPNNVLAYAGIAYGFKGINHNVTNHASGGMQALLEAYHAVKSGQAQRAVVVAYDLATEAQALFYYDQLGLISKKSLKPFDAEHDGTILGDGACAMVIESEASVVARQAKCYAEILGGCSLTEGAGLFSIQSDHSALTETFAQTLAQTNLTAENLDVVVAHGNGNPKSDSTEAAAICATFGNIPVTAFKWSMGHTICTSGMVDAVLASYVLQTGTVPGIANLSNLAPSCASLNVSKNSRQLMRKQRHALIVNRGFAGINSCLVMKSCEE
jgi:3-oxoacyl-[acyl-carrier-protein] synthase I